MKRPLLTASVSVALLVALSACGGPQGPVAPSVADSPQSPILIHPQLEDVIVVPADPGTAQSYSYTSDGRLRYDFRLQNRIDEAFFLRIQATFYDESGVSVDTQQPFRLPVNKFEDKDVHVICGNKKGRKVKVQVAPAN